ncbi:hypothetical protein MUP59_07065 [Candidatus Bathyarchaeota archaeon]|nr:hypothetical protein [Candidatus Bathyarchaeota archaeon]
MARLSRGEMVVYCDICKRPIHDWATHRLSSEHQKKLLEVGGVPVEAKQAGEKHPAKED